MTVVTARVDRNLIVIVAVLGLTTRPAPAQELGVPIAANSPHVVLSITDERDPDDTSFFSVVSAPPAGTALPSNGPPNYAVSIYDTGSPAVIISNEAFEEFGIAAAGRDGINLAPIVGVTDSFNSDPLGVYAAGLGSITSVGPLAADRAAMRGAFNDSIIYAGPGDSLPNLVGTTISGRYTSTISNSAPQIVEVDGTTYRSPAVEIHDLGTVERPSRRLGMTLTDGALGPVPTFLPDFEGIINNIDDLGNNPTTPTLAGSFFLTANVKNNGVERNQLQLLLDTGSQGTIVSEQIAAEMGFDVENDPPDFVVRIAGVTEITEDVPGFFADEFVLPGTDGGLVLRNVPLVVFNVGDPRSPQNTLPGIIGMNLFSDRDLVLNPEPGTPFLGVSDPVYAIDSWNTPSQTAVWSDAANWSHGTVPSITSIADLRNSSASQVAEIHADAQLAAMQVSGNPDLEGGMTVRLHDGVLLDVFGSAILQDGSVVELRDATLDALAVELRGGAIIGSGTVGGEVISQGTIIPGGSNGIGHIDFPGNIDQLHRGRMELEIGGTDALTGTRMHDQITVAGDILLTGTLDILTTDQYEPLADRGVTEELTIVTAGRVLEALQNVTYNGEALDMEFLDDDGKSFQTHAGDGRFLGLSYVNVGDEQQVRFLEYLALPGDADGDGEVQFADFLVVAEHFGGPGGWSEGDFDGDMQVQFRDFLILGDNFGSFVEAQTAAVSVPEPAGWLLAVVGLLPALRRRGNRRS